MSTLPPLDTRTRRALQPLFNAFDAVAAPVHDGVVASGGGFGRGVVLAVSGGPDSRALLEAFARWPRRPVDLDVVVVAVDHRQRPGAADEAAAVVARAEWLGLRGRVAVVDDSVAVGADEATLRAARYGALEAIAADDALDAIVLAHHADDVVEGLLMHLAGVGGGRGGRAPHVVEQRDDGPRRIRPFLALPKRALRAALDALDVADVVVDDDDLAGANARARLRQRLAALHTVIAGDPAGGDVDRALWRHARHRREDDDVLDALVPPTDDVDAALPPALLRRWLLRQVARVIEDPRTSPAAIDDVLRLAAGDTDGDVALRGCTAQVRRTPAGRRVAVVPGAGHSGRRR